MKTNQWKYRVPLTNRILELVDEPNTDSKYLFADHRNTLSINALRMLMNRMEVSEFTPHGFRSSFRDWCSANSSLGFDVFERALAHKHPSTTVNAYARSDLLEQRRVLMLEWNDFVTSKC